MVFLRLCSALFAISELAWSAPQQSPDEFSHSVRPVLAENCGACHNSRSGKGPVNFLKAATANDVEANRGLWRNVAAQLRNRTMPPMASKLSEEDRFRIATWVDNRLRETACKSGDFVGPAVVRRLNRREYHNTVRDLLGVDFDAIATFPADGTGGSGFDTNGETLFIPPMMMEQYMGAAQQILDRAIITPTLLRTFSSADLQPATTVSTASNSAGSREIASGAELSAMLPVYLEGDYQVRALFERTDSPAQAELKVDGVSVGPLLVQQQNFPGAAAAKRGPPRPVAATTQVHLGRGTHNLAVMSGKDPVRIVSLSVTQRPEEPSPERKAVHYRLLGTEPGEEPMQPRKAAERTIRAFLTRAFRRPAAQAEVDRFLVMYDRAAERGDPYEERVKLAFKAVLVWPDFLFRIEQHHDKPGIYPLSQFELATRLSYFLWSTMPDEELFRLADQGRLQDPKVLAAQVDRMIDDPRSRAFTNTFVGQWLGTQDVGGRVVPLINEISSFYNPDVASDLRTQPVLLFERLLRENRSLLDVLNADYTYLTERLVKFYQLEDQVKGVNDNHFHLVQWPDNRRGGILGLGAVLAMTSHYQQTSPVLRGAWALDTLLGTPVPPPPPGVPPLDAGDKNTSELTTRQRLMQHRADPSCSTCHKLMDPIGFGLENFDWMGRWRDKEPKGQEIDATGALPGGQKFNGPVELRQALLDKKEDFIRHLSGKVLGYALSRSLQDGDSCTVQKLVDTLARNNYQARTLFHDVVLSIPFRNTQGGTVKMELVAPPALNLSKVTSKSQDAKNH